MLKKLFVDHPASVNESYYQHMGVAFGFGFQMLIGALACFIHGLVPGLCQKTGSKTILCLNAQLLAKRGGAVSNTLTPIAGHGENKVSQAQI